MLPRNPDHHHKNAERSSAGLLLSKGGEGSGKMMVSFMEVISRVETSSERSQSMDFLDLNDSAEEKNLLKLGRMRTRDHFSPEERPFHGKKDALVEKFLEKTPEIPQIEGPRSEEARNACAKAETRSNVSLESLPRLSEPSSRVFLFQTQNDPVNQNKEPGLPTRAENEPSAQQSSHGESADNSQMFKTAAHSFSQLPVQLSEDLKKAVNGHQSFQNIALGVQSLNEYALRSMEDIKEHLRGLDAEDTPETRSRKVSAQSHSNVMCQGCLAFTIKGKRFMCLKCPQLNLCAKCERKSKHAHPMLRVVDPLDKGVPPNVVAAANLFGCIRDESQETLRLRILKKYAGGNKGDEFYRVFLDQLAGVDLGMFIVKAKDIFQIK